MTGGEPLFVDGQVAGYVTSAAYGSVGGQLDRLRVVPPSFRPAPSWCERSIGGPGRSRPAPRCSIRRARLRA
jgi:hypothetical protein